MSVSRDNRGFFLSRFMILLLGIATMPGVPVLSQTQPLQKEPAPTQPEQAPAERFWLAGRYDGNRIIVYFDAVKFNGTMPSGTHELAPPIAERFYDPVRLPETYIARLQKGPEAEHIAVGDKYDLLLDDGKVATVTLTTLVGTELDEQAGNDSFIGALATIDKRDLPYATKNHYALRRHRETQNGKPLRDSNPEAIYAGSENEPTRFDIQTQIVSLLSERMKTVATDAEKHAADGISPAIDLRTFHLADGSLRYYARAVWNSEEAANQKTVYALAAWIAPQPTLHIIAIQTRTSPYQGLDSVLPGLLNAVDLGGGKTGIIVGSNGEDGSSLDLVEYRDGADLAHMRILHSIGAGE
jgi:hypothetical protein